MIQVPYIETHDIYLEAGVILDESYPINIPIPIPIEQIIENTFKIELEFEEMDKSILGVSEIDKNKIWINETLLGKENEYQMRFTMAHELGHFVLHSKYVNYLKQQTFFQKEICDFYQRNHSRLERQANIFAANILMPPHLFIEKFIGITDIRTPYSLEEERKLKRKYDFGHTKSEIIIDEMSNIFEVSHAATKIQLEQLKIFY
jgi:Zn-dependent peptidase ImmA (M78 family)